MKRERGFFRLGWVLGLGLLVCGAARLEGAESQAAVLYGDRSGRIVVVAESGPEGRRLAGLSEEAWAVWENPFGLPERWPAEVTVRLVPEAKWTAAEPAWRVVSETPGIVTVWIKAGGEAGVERDRRWLMAMAEGVLHRQALLLGVGPERVWVPDWLIAAGAEAVLTSGSRGALLDSWRQEARKAGRMPGLVALFSWKGGVQEREDGGDERVWAAFAAWQWLRREAGATAAWRRLVAGLIAGAPPRLALNAAYGERFRRMPMADLELTWQIAAAGLARERALPGMSAEDSRRWLEELDRLVVVDGAGSGGEVPVRLSEVWAEREEAVVARARAMRMDLLSEGFARVHPFYRNAAGSLGRVWLAQADGREQDWAQAREEWRADGEMGRELERASAALLDAAERRG